MHKILAISMVMAVTGCCSYSQLDRNMGAVKVDGEQPVATYEVVNVSYKLLGFVPLTTGVTWKQGPYAEDVGSMAVFCDECSLDDCMESVRHACKTMGSDRIVDLTGRVDDSWAWSLFTVKKRVVKASCVVLKRQ